MSQESERLRSLYDRARSGDLKAGKELIHACRRGMLCPNWEKPPKIDRKRVKEHLKRREGVGSGRQMR